MISVGRKRSEGWAAKRIVDLLRDQLSHHGGVARGSVSVDAYPCAVDATLRIVHVADTQLDGRLRCVGDALPHVHVAEHNDRAGCHFRPRFVKGQRPKEADGCKPGAIAAGDIDHHCAPTCMCQAAVAVERHTLAQADIALRLKHRGGRCVGSRPQELADARLRIVAAVPRDGRAGARGQHVHVCTTHRLAPAAHCANGRGCRRGLVENEAVRVRARALLDDVERAHACPIPSWARHRQRYRAERGVELREHLLRANGAPLVRVCADGHDAVSSSEVLSRVQPAIVTLHSLVLALELAPPMTLCPRGLRLGRLQAHLVGFDRSAAVAEVRPCKVYTALGGEVQLAAVQCAHAI